MLKTTTQKKDTHILITFEEEITFDELLKVLTADYDIPDFWDYNVVTHFKNCLIKLNIEEFKEVVEVINKQRPENAKREKSALVFDTYFAKSLGEIYKQETIRFHYEVEVFDNLELAEFWAAKFIN